MKIITLTTPHDKPLYINMEHIVSFRAVLLVEDAATSTVFTADGQKHFVKETLNEIIQQLL